MRRLFPLSTRASDLRSMAGVILVYLAISIVAGIAFSVLATLPFLGPILSLAAQMANLYCLFGIIVSVLFYRNLIG